MITVLFFAQLSESAGQRRVTYQSGESHITVKQLAEAVALDLPSQLKEDLFDGTVLVAVNKQHADWQTLVSPGDEVAFLPPVSGG